MALEESSDSVNAAANRNSNRDDVKRLNQTEDEAKEGAVNAVAKEGSPAKYRRVGFKIVKLILCRDLRSCRSFQTLDVVYSAICRRNC